MGNNNNNARKKDEEKMRFPLFVSSWLANSRNLSQVSSEQLEEITVKIA